VLGYWLYHHQGTLTPLFTRMTLLGMLLLAAGVQLGLSALLLGTTRSTIGTAPIHELLTEARHHTLNDSDRIDPSP
jgi:hypothetical protein